MGDDNDWNAGVSPALFLQGVAKQSCSRLGSKLSLLVFKVWYSLVELASIEADEACRDDHGLYNLRSS